MNEVPQVVNLAVYINLNNELSPLIINQHKHLININI